MKQKQTLKCNEPLTGRRVCLQRLHPGHADVLLDSFSNESFWETYRSNQNRSLSRGQLSRLLQHEYERLPGQVGKIEWLITKPVHSLRDVGGEKQPLPIGLASLSAFDSGQRRAEFLIGFFNKEDIKPGLGVEASLLTLNFAFNHEHLHKLVSFVYADNVSAQRSTIALGFRNEGLLKSHFRTGKYGAYTDVYQNGFLAADFRGNTRLARLSRRILGYDMTLDTSKEYAGIKPERDCTEISASFTLQEKR